MYQEINPEMWAPAKDGDFVEGVLVRKQSDIGENKSMLYTIKTSEGMRNIWGSAILDERMALVNLEEKIKITYKGVSKEAKKGHNPAKIFKVEVDKEASD